MPRVMKTLYTRTAPSSVIVKMAAITIKHDFVGVSSGNKVKIYSLTCDEVKSLEIPQNIGANEDDKLSKKLDDRSGRILCMKFSPCAKYFAVSNDKKQLIVWETSNWQVVTTRFINKQASQLCFTQKEEILTADRCGDVYLYNITETTNENRLIMGRISLLLDLILSNDGKYLITCDRDEKICVSHFPNSYNIQSYCLGHSEFVSSISLLPLLSDILVSSSGDGTLRFWDFKNGNEKLCINCAKQSNGSNLKTERLMRLNETSTKTDAIKKCICMPNENIVVILYFSYSDMEIYSVEISQENSSFTHFQTLSFTNIPYDAAFDDDGRLWIIQLEKTQPIAVFKLSNEKKDNLKFISDDLFEKKIKLNEELDFFKDAVNSPTDISMMFKQWFDNVGEYLQKKEERIKEKNNKKSKTMQ